MKFFRTAPQEHPARLHPIRSQSPGQLPLGRISHAETLTASAIIRFIMISLKIFLLNLQRSKEALTVCEQALGLAPYLALAYICKGDILAALQRNREADLSYAQALLLQPNQALVYNNLGIALAQMQHTKQAIRAYQRAIALDPTDDIVYYNLSLAQDLNRWQEARQVRLRAEALGLALDEALTCQEEVVAWEDLPTIRHIIPTLQAAGSTSRKLRAVSSQRSVG